MRERSLAMADLPGPQTMYVLGSPSRLSMHIMSLPYTGSRHLLWIPLLPHNRRLQSEFLDLGCRLTCIRGRVGGAPAHGSKFRHSNVRSSFLPLPRHIKPKLYPSNREVEVCSFNA